MSSDSTMKENWDGSPHFTSGESPTITLNKSDFMGDMVANCAHDLKTPLAAIYNSNQLAINILSDVQVLLAQLSPTSTSMINDLAVVKSTLETSLDMTEFMKMSINRVMEYTKVKTHSMKLSPKNGTIEVAQAFALPLKCMTSVDSEQVVDFKPLPVEMCSHIITDQQWLQENVLCLASNASKYSSKGTITLTVSLSTEVALVSHDENGLRDTFSQSGPLSSTSTRSAHDLRNLAVGSIGSMGSSAESQSQDFGDIRNSSTRSLLNLTRQTSLNLEHSKMMVVVEVEDTGIGLSEEGMANLFAPFKQAQRLAGGTGLGLFSLANRMKALQGHCGVRGRRDGHQGCLFWFAFPYKPDQEAAEAALEQDLTAESLAKLSVTHNFATEAQMRYKTSPNSPSVHTSPGVQSPDPNSPGTPSPASPPSPGLGIFIPDGRKMSSREVLGASKNLPPQFPPLSPSDQSLRSEEGMSARLANWKGANSPLPELIVPRASRHPQRSAPTPPRPTPRSSCPPSPGADSEHHCGTSTGDSHSVDYDILATDQSLHILLVDDTPTILKICSRTLMREGYRVTTAENGLEALKLLHSNIVFDAVLMDLQMPVLDGLETVLRYRAEESATEGKKRLFIVAVSANSDPDIAEGAIEAGFDGFIEKPFTIKGLQNVLPPDLGMDIMLRRSDSKTSGW